MNWNCVPQSISIMADSSKNDIHWSTRLWATFTALIFWIGTATVKRVKSSTIVRRLEQPWLISKGPTIYIWMYWNRRLELEIRRRVLYGCRYVLNCWQGKQARVEHLCWRTYIWRKSILRMPECARLLRAWNIYQGRTSGTNACEFPVDTSHQREREQ